jgi:hypothetical protein
MLESSIALVIETDFQVLLNSLLESSIYEAFGMLLSFVDFKRLLQAKLLMRDLICCFMFLTINRPPSPLSDHLPVSTRR